MSKSAIKIINIDLDDVCAGWNDYVAEKFGIDIGLNLPNGLWPYFGSEEWRVKLDSMMDEQSFWEELQPCLWARKLVDECKSIAPTYFLSKARPTPECMAGKMNWVKNYFPDMVNNLTLVTNDKWICANGNLLIDDDLRHKEGWESRGGTFFHWESLRNCEKNVEEALNRIEKINGILY